jgi:hypothetical protein
MANNALQIQRLAGGVIPPAAPVVFDNIVYSAGNIGYDPLTGIITLQEPGRYLINWNVATLTTSLPNGAVFMLSSSQGDALEGNSPLRTGLVTGAGIIDVVSAPVTVSLINSVGGNASFTPQIPVKANLILASADPVTGLADSSICFEMAQFVHVLEQLIALYPTNTWSVFTTHFTSITSMPEQLFASPDAGGPGLLVMRDANDVVEILPIASIVAIYIGDGAVYDPSISYLTPPAPLPEGCDTNLIAAIRDYLNMHLNEAAQLWLGTIAVASGPVFRSEYGVVVLSDEAGNTPIFIPASQIAIFTVTNNSDAARTAATVKVENDPRQLPENG